MYTKLSADFHPKILPRKFPLSKQFPPSYKLIGSEPDSDRDQLRNWASCNDFHLIHDSKQRGTFRSARWNRDYSPDLCWISTIGGHPQTTLCTVLDDFPRSQHRPSVIHIGLQLRVIRGIEKRRWNFRKADWAEFMAATERSIPTIPVNTVSVEESYTRLTGTIMKAAKRSIPRGFRPHLHSMSG